MWRIVPLETRDAYMNMGIDEAISESVAEGYVNPTIRFYRWRPSAVSIGYFQDLEDEVDIEACNQDSIDFVRRRTGGGAVYHDYHGEITYSIIGSLSLFPDDIGDSYREICDFVIRGLAELGVEAEFEPVNDIVAGGKKISGNAQTRRKNVLLQHGTVLYRVEPEKMFRYLDPDIDKVSDKVISGVEERVTSVSGLVECDIQDTYESLLDGFSFGREIEIEGVSEREENRAEELSRERYRSDSWNFNRSQ